MHHVVIIGGGFGGLYAARSLRRAPVRVTLVDRRNFHLFQPLLYQVATGGLSPANISAPLRSILKRQKNAGVLLAEVCDFDLEGRRVLLTDGELHYDTLVVSAGAGHHYFGHDDWAGLAPGLKSIEDATNIRRRIFLAFEAAERQPDPDLVRRWLTFVIVGGGPTGVELAGALAEIARDTLRREFRSINPADAKILLLEGMDCVLSAYPPALSEKAKRQLQQLGVAVRCGARVTDIQPEAVTIQVGDLTEVVPARTVLWGAGVKASSLGTKLSQAAGIETDRAGRVPVEADCSVHGRPEVFVIGDLARYPTDDGQSLPGVAPVAIQQGKYVAKLIRRQLKGKTSPPFHYRDFGTMATIGRNRAVAMVGPFRFSGLLAWLAWLFVHLMYIVEFQNRVLVLIQWAWHYFSWNRAARLITGESPLPLLPRNRECGESEAAGTQSMSGRSE